jgi:hypothetical protein
LSDEDLREIARDPYEFAQEMYRSARSQYVEDTPYEDHGELKDTLSRAPALEGKFEDDEEIEEFDEFIANVWENMDVEEKETLLMASEYRGDRGDVDEWAEFLYNEYIANKEED